MAVAAAAAAAADFAGWLALCTYLAQFRILRFTFKGSSSSLTRVDPWKGRTCVNHYYRVMILAAQVTF